MSDLVILNIGAPFWGLICGIAISKVFEKKLILKKI
jgi:predicted benzoate:H+ symporter BenE